jgi:SAM-dependent methyltransferase
MRALAQQRAVHHPLFARVYARVGHLMDTEIGDHRRRLLAGLTGRVLEVGAGNGLNFPYYPATVTEVLAIEPEPYLRRLALAPASQASVPIRVVDGTAEALPAPDGAVDAVVSAWSCAPSSTWRAPWPRSVGCCARVGGCASTSTCGPQIRGWPAGRTGWSAHGGGWSAAATPTGTR